MNDQTAKYFEKSARGLRASGLLRTIKIDPGHLLCEIEARVLHVAPALQNAKLYSTEELCGHVMWRRLGSDGPRRAAGMCLAYLVACEAVPLMLHWTPSGKGPKRYMLLPEVKGHSLASA